MLMADFETKPTHGLSSHMDWSSHGLANLQTSQLAEMFDAKFGKDYRIGTARCTTSAE